MKPYADYTRSERCAEYAALQEQYDAWKAKELSLNMARGKPSRAQLDMVSGILTVLQSPEDCFDGALDVRNYGELTGIPSAKRLFAELLGVTPSQVLVGGSASLNLMYDLIAKAWTHGLLHSPRPWSQEPVVRFLCPAPGYDRHFRVSQSFGMELIPIAMTPDGPDMGAVEAAVRRYAGKPIINSVNGKQQIMDEIFPLVAHYGTNVVGLTLDEDGIPDTAEARFAIAERIVTEAARYGIGPDRILIDCLVMTASTNQRQAEQILRAMSLCKERLGVKCALGVSNISFGLPARPLLGSVFLAAAFGAGLDAPIMNPGSKRFMDTVYSYRVLSVEDEGSTGYIERYAGWTDPYKIAANPAAAQAASSDAAPAAGTASSDGNDDPIRHMVVSGRKGEIAAETERLLADHDAMDLINNHFIPALDEVGVLFDQGKFFLPQLMASAEAARVGFDTIKRLMPAGEIADKGKICVATVKGDIHDIGKNIVKMLLDNYGYTVFDLGRDVDPQEVLKTVKERDIKLVGLSALMTTTVVAMEETIKLLHAEVPGVKIIVGGAVLTPEYAKQIGADYYAKDAKASADIAKEVLG